MFAVIGTAFGRAACCHPDAVSPLKVTVASKRAGVGPEPAGVRAGVRRGLVEADAGDVPGDVGAEPRADFHCGRVAIVDGAGGTAVGAQIVQGQA